MVEGSADCLRLIWIVWFRSGLIQGVGGGGGGRKGGTGHRSVMKFESDGDWIGLA